MASSKNAGRRRFITREHTSDTSEVDALTVKTPEEECEQKRLENINLPRDTPSAFVRVKPSSKSATLERTFRESKNGLALSSSRRLPLPPLVPVSSEPNPQFHLASEKIVQQPLIYTPLETSTGFLPKCDSLSLGFRPIRRDSLGSTSSSLAGSTVDSELTISNAPPDQIDSPQKVVKPPPHPACKDLTDSVSKLRPWSYYEGGMLVPRTVLSSTGSASSYDNLDKTDSLAQQKNASQFNSDTTQIHPLSSPRFCHLKHFESNPKRTPSPPSVRRRESPFRSDEDRQFYIAGSRMLGNKSGDACKESLNMTGEDKGESAHFLEGVCRRRMAGGHVQVIPPHLVGVFDPSRFIPTNSHAPSETTPTSVIGGSQSKIEVEATNSLSLMKKPELAPYPALGKLPSKSPAQPSFIVPSESSAKSFLPPVARGHTNKEMTDHSLSIHTNPTLPFASKDSGLRSGEKLANTLLPKVNAGCKSYRNNEDSLARDTGSKSSDKHLFTASRKGGSNISNQEQELSSVTDLFHYVVPSVDSSQLGGPVLHEAARCTATQKPQDIQMPSVKNSAFSATNHSSPSKQGSPKYLQTSAQKCSPKWDSLPLSKGGQKYEQTSLPNASVHKNSPKQNQSSPKWERTSAAKINPTSSPKSSPKQERTSNAKRSLKWEAPGTVTAKASQHSASPRSISNWEPTLASKDNTRSKALPLTSSTNERVIASFSASGNLEKAENLQNAHIMEKAHHNQAVSGSKKLQLQSVSNDSIRMHEKPTVSGDCSQPRLKMDRDKRKAISTQLQTIGASDSVFSARRKQFSSPLSPSLSADRADRPNRTGTDVRVERYPRSAATVLQNMVNQKETVMNSQLKSETSTSPSDKANLDRVASAVRNSNSPRKVADETICHSDAASDKTGTSSTSSSHSIEKRREAEQQRFRTSESGESDVHSARSAAENTEAIKVHLGQDVLQEQTVMGVAVTESGSAAAAGTYSEATKNLNDANDSVAGKSVEDATISGSTVSTAVVAKVSADEKEIYTSVVDIADTSNFEVSPPKIKLPARSPQTKTFTDILESIQVVTQPCGAHTASSSQETPGTTPVSGPQLSCLVPFSLFDIHDDSVVKSSQSPLPDETFTVEVSEEAEKNKAGQPVAVVGEIMPSGEKSLGSFSDELAKLKTERNADVANNNLKETGPSLQSICFEQRRSNSLVRGRRSLDSISSSSLGELPRVGLLVDEKPTILTTVAESNQIATSASELSYPDIVEKAIFTVDKEISFVSRVVEPDKRNSLPRKTSSQMPPNVQHAVLVEYLPLEPESPPNVKLLAESAPVCFATISSVVNSSREISQNHTVSPVDKMPSAFKNSDLGSIQDFPALLSTSHLNVTKVDPNFKLEKNCLSSSTQNVVLDSHSRKHLVNMNEAGSLVHESDLDKKYEVASDLDEFYETVDQGGTDSKVSTASLDQMTQEKEIFELVNTSAAYLKPEMASASSFTSSHVPLPKTQESPHPAGKSELLGTLSVPQLVITQNRGSAKRDFVFPSKESLPVNVNKLPEAFAEYPGFDKRANCSPSKSEVSPVMAALDDALAVLTSVVMENKNTGGDTLRRNATSAVKLKKDILQPDIEKVIFNLNTETKKPVRSKSTNKEGLSVSKKKNGGSHKDHHTFDVSPVATATSHHSDPQEVTDIVRQEIQTVENRRHQLTKEDSFNRPDSPMFHETLPLPKDSVIKRNREHCRDTSSSSDSDGSPQMAPRNQRRGKRCQDANKSTSLTTPSEVSGYRPFMGAHSSGLTLSRHQSDIILDAQSLAGTSFPAGQHLHKSRRHNSDSADAAKSPWPKTISLAQGMDTVTALPARDAKRRADRFPLPSDIQQSLLLYNQQHGGRRGQSWMQTIDASVKGAFTGTIHPKDKTG